MKKKHTKSNKKPQNKKSQVFCPEYMLNFSCIGSACPDSCCAGWTVSIDKETFKKYRNYRGNDEHLRTLFTENVLPNTLNRSAMNTAQIKMDENNACPFLDENSLCRIQLAQGHDALSHTCTTYPRTLNQINDELEYSATLSCPEVARMVLLNPEGLRFTSTPLELPKSLTPNFTLSRISKSPLQLVQKYFYPIQFTGINILQNRLFSLEYRLILIGELSKKILTVAFGEEELFDRIMQQYDKLAFLKLFVESFDSIEPQHFEQIELLKKWSEGDAKYHKIAETALAAIIGDKRDTNDESEKSNEIDESSKKEILARYQEGLEKYSAFVQKKSYILENYLVNTMFQEAYPGVVYDDNIAKIHISLAHFLLSMKFIILRTTIIGLLIKGEELTDEYILSLIQLFAKRFHHSPGIKNNFMHFYQEEENRSESISQLLKL